MSSTGRLDEAVRVMRAGEHIGKIALSIPYNGAGDGKGQKRDH